MPGAPFSAEERGGILVAVSVMKSQASSDREATEARLAAQRRELLERELHRYMSILETREGLHLVIVFGSLSTDRVHQWSDLDLLIVQDTNLPFLKRTRAMRKLLQPQVGTDLLVYTPSEFDRMSRDRPFVKKEILGRGRVVYERGS